MTDVPSNRNHRIVKALGQWCDEWAGTPAARRAMNAFDTMRDFDALAYCITDGLEDVGGLDDTEEVVMASEAHYKRLARKIVEYSRLYPEDAPCDLAMLLTLIELVPYGRTYELKRRAGML